MVAAVTTTTNFTGIGITAPATNPRIGSAILVGGTIAVANTAITATDKVFLSVTTPGGTQGNLSCAIVAGTGFTINSDSATETSTVDYLIVKAV